VVSGGRGEDELLPLQGLVVDAHAGRLWSPVDLGAGVPRCCLLDKLLGGGWLWEDRPIEGFDPVRHG
jgi:hypothetical protein